jgi:acylglycerol lipase
LTSIDVAKLRDEYSGPHELVRASDGATLFVRRWEAEGKSRASVLLLHGITGYSGPYGQMVAQGLAASGYDVFGMDLRGHGLSDGRRGDYPSGERFRLDLAETLALVKPKSRKLVVMGHSLGALSAVVATKNNPQSVDGLILASVARKIRTGVYPKPSASATIKTLIGITFLHGTPLIEYSRRGQMGRDDPLFDFRYSARFYSVLYGASALKVVRMFQSGFVDSTNLDLGGKLGVPLLVAVGDSDELFPVDGAKEFYESIPCDDKEFVVLPRTKHAAWPNDAYVPIAAWLEKKF